MSDQRREFTDQRYVFFLTFSVYRRGRLLTLDHPKRIVLGVLNHQLEAMQGKCISFVVMRDHVHALLWLPNPQDLRRFVHAGWHRFLNLCERSELEARFFAAAINNDFRTVDASEHVDGN